MKSTADVELARRIEWNHGTCVDRMQIRAEVIRERSFPVRIIRHSPVHLDLDRLGNNAEGKGSDS